VADETVNPLVWLMDLVADAVDWIHETFSDPALSRELRSDLGVDDEGNLQGQLPTGEKLRMRHPNGDPVDVDKAAFDTTVAEVRQAYGLLVDFFGSLDLSLDELWDVLFLLGQVGAAESVRVRSDVAYAAARAFGFLGGLGSTEEVEALNVLRAVDLLGGRSGAPSDVTDPGVAQGVRNWVGLGLAVAAVLSEGELPVQVRASYGYEPDLDSTTPAVDKIAQTAATIDVSTLDPVGDGTDVHAGLTWIYVPPKGNVPFKLHLAVGGGISHTSGRLTLSLEVPAAGNILISRPWDFSAGTLVRAVAAYGRADAKALEFGELDGPHLLVESIQLRVELSANSSIRLEFRLVDVSLALADADRFVSSLSDELKSRFDLALVYDRNGFRMEGGPRSLSGGQPQTPALPAAAAGPAVAAGPVGTTSDGLEANVPARNTQFGPFRIQKGHFAIGRSPDGTRQTGIEISTSADIDIGPFNLTIDRIGMRLDLRAGGVEPNLGLLDLDFGFKAPTGIGVTIDAKAVKGGGFLYLDEEKGEYAGVLELSFKGLSIKAVGLLNTKAPDPAGWSLLLLLYAEFRETPWQIGLGFTITAIGGILGLQHVASVEQLRASLGTNAFDDVLFPADPVKNAPRILGRLRTLFPVQAHALTVGPVVEVNWGTPPLVTARLGILAQFTGAFGGGDFRFTRLTVIGTVRAMAPPREVDAPRLVDLTADVLGDFDVESGLLAIDARLRDSKLGGVEFSGSLIVRVGMGANPAFAIAAGGFHPAFTDLPPALPARIDRLGLVWRIGDSVVLTLQAYAAVTASSWQLGALFTLRAEIGPVDIDGALGFDAIAYDDGRFSVSIGGHVKIRWRGHTLMAVSIKVVLDRNAQQVWHAAGSASFSILWWDKEVDFEETWGTARSLPPAPPVDAAALVRAGLEDPGSWATQLPARGDSLVTLADPPPDTGEVARVMAHPLGALTVTQRVAPLGLRLDQIDGSPVAPGTVVAIGAVRIGTDGTATTRPTRQIFPRARFQALSEDERLTQKSFESFPAGVAITPAGETNPAGTVTAFDFEPVNLAPEQVTKPPPTGTFPGLLPWHVSRGRAARSPVRQAERLLRGAPSIQIDVGPPAVAVVDDRSLDSAAVLTEAEARSPTLARQQVRVGQLVVEAHEIGV
jgi:hypothetical protein